MLLISLSLFGMTACSDGGANSYEQITPQEAKTIIDTEKDYVIIDARTTEEFAEGHIADAILIPEIPYDIKKVAKVVEARAKSNKGFTILAVAEGAMDKEEAKLKKKEREAKRAAEHFSASAYVAQQLRELVGVEARNVVPGHIQRGGSPNAYDRVLSTQFGVHAAELIRDGVFGVTVALKGNQITHNKLSDIAGVPKPVEKDNPVVATARDMGICLGD